MLDEALKKTAVLGAGGKMGSGIALLLLEEMARLEAEKTGYIGKGEYRLYLIDSNPDVLDALRTYLKTQIVRYAERNINALRRYFASNPSLISNEEVIRAFAEGALNNIRYHSLVSEANDAKLVFEAIVEDENIKARIFSEFEANALHEVYYFTNTSSIPIHILNQKAELHNRIAGFHFYNPPAVQKLVEVILPQNCNPEVIALTSQLAKKLKKVVVTSKDIAGFIGNGHFLREIMYACDQVKKLSADYSLPESIYMINKVTQEFLIRPMGIFQLLDYVGIDVCQRICQIMSDYLPNELFQSSLVDEMLKEGCRGGQYPDGSQKDGFFRYTQGLRTEIWSPGDHAYIPLNHDPLIEECDSRLGPFPSGHASWKHMQKDEERKKKLKLYFQNLFHDNGMGAGIAQAFILKSREIVRYLVSSGVAANPEDVAKVLEYGFFHLYSPEEVLEGVKHVKVS